MIRFQRFQNRIFFFFAGLLLLVLIVVYLAVNFASIRNATRQVEEELRVAGRVFHLLLNSRMERLAESARLLSGDFAFKTAYASGDKNTIISAMHNHSMRVGADIMKIVTLDHYVSADTQHPDENRAIFEFSSLITEAETNGEASAISILNSEPYQLVIVPLLAPLPIAWICIGFKVDNKLARDFQKITRLDISFILDSLPGQRKIVASTLNKKLSSALVSFLESSISYTAKITEMRLNDEDFISIRLSLENGKDRGMKVIMQRSLKKAMAQFYTLRFTLIILFTVSILISLSGAVFIARSVTRPVLLLAEGAKKIEKGDYQFSVSLNQQDELGKLAKAFNSMVSGISQREDRIKHQALHERLTGLPNREFLYIEIEKALKATVTESFIVLFMINLNRFKTINATLGLKIGDLLLQNVGRRINDIQNNGIRAFHLGADNFALLRADVKEENDVKNIALGLLKVFEEPFQVGNYPIAIDARIGITIAPLHGKNPDTLIKFADIATALAKKNVDNYKIYSPEMDTFVVRHLTLLGEMRQAMEGDELILYYQPKIDVRKKKISGVESLIRWIHPEHGLIPPDDFIPLAEQTGLIKPLSLWILKKAIAQAGDFAQLGLEVKVAINLSARNLQDDRLPLDLGSLMDKNKIDPARVIIEITESALMTDPDRSMRIIRNLKSLGLLISIDDFGIGYSSLSYLQKLPVSEIKVDKSFVSQMDKVKNDAIIVHAIIELAHNIGIEVTAEGVENMDTWNMLMDYGCDRGQGYFFSKPLPQGDLMEWLRNSEWGITS